MAGGNSLRALVVEDDMALQRAVAVMLDRAGYQVFAVESGAEAMDVAGQMGPDAVVIDLALAGDLGLRLLPALLTVAPGCTIVVLSPFDALRGPALDAGAFALMDTHDLRPLERCLALTEEAAHFGCECCPLTSTPGDPGTTIALDPSSAQASVETGGNVIWTGYSDPKSSPSSPRRANRSTKPPRS